MSNKDNIPDQITCKSIKLAGPIQGKKIEIQVDVKPIKQEAKPNYNWQILFNHYGFKIFTYNNEWK